MSNITSPVDGPQMSVVETFSTVASRATWVKSAVRQ